MNKMSYNLHVLLWQIVSTFLYLQRSENFEMHFQESLVPSEAWLDPINERSLLNSQKEKEK